MNYRQLLFDAKTSYTITLTDEEAQEKADKYNSKILTDAEKIYNHYLSQGTDKAEERKKAFLSSPNNRLKSALDFKYQKG